MIQQKKEELFAWLGISPYLAGFLLFYLGPFLLTALMSFTNIKYISRLDRVKWIHLKNYVELLGDSRFWNAFWNTCRFSLLYVPLVISFALLFAVLVNQNLYMRRLIRSMIFMPYVSNIVAVALVWSVLLDPQDGPVNMILRALGTSDPPRWLLGSSTSLFSLVLISVWQGLGLQFITFLAALQDVPPELREAAQIDGANKRQVFFHITLPTISPVTFLLVITSIIISMKNFAVVQTLTNGGPGDSSTVLSLLSVETAFSSFRMGYASAQAMILFLLMLIVTLVQFKLEARKDPA